MNVNAELGFFEMRELQQGLHKSDVGENTWTEIYPDIAPPPNDGRIKIKIITTTSVGKDYLKITSEAGYKAANYTFPKLLKSTDQITIKVIANLAKDALKRHIDLYNGIEKAVIFQGIIMPDKTYQQLTIDIAERIKIGELKPGQHN